MNAKKKKKKPSLLAGFPSRIARASQLICLSCMNIGIFDVQLFSDNKEPIDIITRPLFFFFMLAKSWMNRVLGPRHYE